MVAYSERGTSYPLAKLGVEDIVSGRNTLFEGKGYKWDQELQDWVDPETGDIVDGPMPAKEFGRGGTGRPSTWKEVKGEPEDPERFKKPKGGDEGTAETPIDAILTVLQAWVELKFGK